MRRMLAIVGGLALGLCFSQFPEYAQQYEQRLGGAVDELKTIVADFDRDATRYGLTREDALKRYAVSPDDFLVARGTSMDKTLARYALLSGMLTDLQNAGPVQRFAHLGDYLDTDVGARALETYKPAVPVTFEGLAWALGGFVLGYLLVFPLIGFLTLPFRWRRGKAAHRQVPLRREKERRSARKPQVAAASATVPLAHIARERRRLRAEKAAAPEVETGIAPPFDPRLEMRPPPGAVPVIEPRPVPTKPARAETRVETQREREERIVRGI